MTVTFEPDADWLVYLANPRQPDLVLPPGAVDAHCHVFGPGRVFPYAPERKYTPVDAPKEKLFALRDFRGFDRNVIVQATCHGADNRALVDALAAADDRARGVATIRPGVTRSELADMLGKPPLSEHVMQNVSFDTCVYHQPGIDLLFSVIDSGNIVFGSEMVGAVRGKDPQTGHYFDDTRRYVDAAGLSAADAEKVYSGNARRVYPRLDQALRARGL